VGTLFITSLVSYISLKSSIIEHNQEHLKNAIQLINMEIQDQADLDKLAHQVNLTTGLRVTFVNADGVVVGESEVAKESMENHGSRYEIMQSNSEEFAHIVRYSDTLSVDFLYVAKKIVYKNEPMYIRLSISLAKLMEDFYSLWIKLAVLFFIILILAFYISKRMSARVLYDIEQLTNYLDEISNKNYKAIIKTKYFYEFLQISLLLKNLVKKLSNRDKQKRKYTAKLRLVNKQRSDILSAISHEFKNPVASIMGYAQTLEEDPDIDPKIRAKFLEKISSNGEKISKMLDRLALSVKLENNDLEIHESEFDMKTLANEVAANLLLKYKDREIHVNVPSKLINADKTMIELVLINLLDNALKYSQNDVYLSLENDIVSVRDTGIGIKEEHLDKVTSKFYRVDKNSWDNSMGIGLAMVSYILKAHNSLLVINSTFAKGSVFSFSIKEMIKK
jgi:two-component system phosphate regulon sensor histidine kinase PhoR